MTKIEKLQNDSNSALKEKQTLRRSVLTSIIGAVKKVSIDQRVDITDSLVDTAVAKEKKIVAEQISTCPADRPELLDEYTRRLSVIEEYMPKLMGKDEVLSFVSGNLSSDIKDMGSAMKVIMPMLKGKADNGTISACVKEVIASR